MNKKALKLNGMSLDEYQLAAQKYSLHTNIGDCRYGNVVYGVLGLVGEAGEVSDQMKKVFRDDGGQITEERYRKLVKELGDVLWYLQDTCWSLGLPLSLVAETNIKKLEERLESGTLQGR